MCTSSTSIVQITCAWKREEPRMKRDTIVDETSSMSKLLLTRQHPNWAHFRKLVCDSPLYGLDFLGVAGQSLQLSE